MTKKERKWNPEAGGSRKQEKEGGGRSEERTKKPIEHPTFAIFIPIRFVLQAG